MCMPELINSAKRKGLTYSHLKKAQLVSLLRRNASNSYSRSRSRSSGPVCSRPRCSPKKVKRRSCSPRPLNRYFTYAAQHRPSVRAANPGLPMKEISRILGTMYKADKLRCAPSRSRSRSRRSRSRSRSRC